MSENFWFSDVFGDIEMEHWTKTDNQKDFLNASFLNLKICANYNLKTQRPISRTLFGSGVFAVKKLILAL